MRYRYPVAVTVAKVWVLNATVFINDTYVTVTVIQRFLLQKRNNYCGLYAPILLIIEYLRYFLRRYEFVQYDKWHWMEFFQQWWNFFEISYIYSRLAISYIYIYMDSTWCPHIISTAFSYMEVILNIGLF